MYKKSFLILILALLIVLAYFYGLPYFGKKALQKGEKYYYSKQYDKAIKEFRIAERFGKNKLRPIILTGYAYKFRNDYDNAIKNFKKVLNVDPNNDEASGGLVDALFKAKKYDEAEKEAMKRLEYVSKKEDVYAELAKIYYAKGELDKAQEYAIKNVVLNDARYNPDSYRVGSRLLLAGITYNLEDYDGAIEILKEAESISPDTPLIYKSLAQVYEKIGDKEKALENWSKVASLNDYTPEFRSSVEQKVIQIKTELGK